MRGPLQPLQIPASKNGIFYTGSGSRLGGRMRGRVVPGRWNVSEDQGMCAESLSIYRYLTRQKAFFYDVINAWIAIHSLAGYL